MALEPLTINELLPQEILLQVFSNFDDRDLTIVAKVCKLWQKISGDESLWKFHSLNNMPQFKVPLKGRTWKEHYFLNHPGMTIRQIHCNRDVIYSAWGKAICAWKKNTFGGTFACYTTDTGHKGSVSSFLVRFIGMTTLMYTGSTDNTVKVWGRVLPNYQFQLKQTLAKHEAPITSICSVSNGIVCSDINGNLYYWKKNIHNFEHELKNKLSAHNGRITHICVDKFGLQTSFFTASLDKTIKAWRISSKGIVHEQTIKNNHGKITAMEMPIKSQILYAGYGDGTVRNWRKNKLSELEQSSEFQAHKGPVRELHFSKNGKQILTSSDHCVKSWVRTVKADNEAFALANLYLTDKDERVTSVQTGLDFRQKHLKDIYYLSSSQLTKLTINQVPGRRVTKSTVPIATPDPLVTPVNVPYKSIEYTPRPVIK